jgi:hypothetical protein
MMPGKGDSNSSCKSRAIRRLQSCKSCGKAIMFGSIDSLMSNCRKALQHTRDGGAIVVPAGLIGSHEAPVGAQVAGAAIPEPASDADNMLG